MADRILRWSEWAEAREKWKGRFHPHRHLPWFGSEFNGEFVCSCHADQFKEHREVTCGHVGQERTEVEFVDKVGVAPVFHVHGKKEKCKVCGRSLLEVRKAWQEAQNGR